MAVGPPRHRPPSAALASRLLELQLSQRRPLSRASSGASRSSGPRLSDTQVRGLPTSTSSASTRLFSSSPARSRMAPPRRAARCPAAVSGASEGFPGQRRAPASTSKRRRRTCRRCLRQARKCPTQNGPFRQAWALTGATTTTGSGRRRGTKGPLGVAAAVGISRFCQSLEQPLEDDMTLAMVIAGELFRDRGSGHEGILRFRRRARAAAIKRWAQSSEFAS